MGLLTFALGVAAWRDRRRGRLLEISDLLAALKLHIGGGSYSTIARDSTQREIRNRLGRMLRRACDHGCGQRFRVERDQVIRRGRT